MADYKFDTIATQSIEWTGSTGVALVVKVSLVQESTDYFGTGDWQPVRDGLRIKTEANAGGVDQGFCALESLENVPGATHKVGRIALTAERAAEVAAAIKALKTHPAWLEKMAKQEAGIKASREYEAHARAVNKMLMPGGSY